ncbi:hypothetical protein MY55_00645 [Chromobacterium subtsugae]|nr:hypothetical protein MY55_00645 [Chromobacterium subtsugae]
MNRAGYLQGQQPFRLPDAVLGQTDGAPAAVVVVPVRHLETESMVAVAAQAGWCRACQAFQTCLIMAGEQGQILLGGVVLFDE